MSATETSRLLEHMQEFIGKYVVLPSAAAADAIALWVLHTWALDGAHATPYLLVLSPEKRSGKTRLLEVLELLTAKPWTVTSASEAAMFRKIAADRPTLLLDEVDAIFGANSERTEPLRAILNSGNRPGAVVARCVGEGGKQRVEDFSVFCPKILAGIETGRLPDTIRDRGIEIAMKRRVGAEKVQRLRVRDAERDAIDLVESALGWAERHVETLHEAYPDLPDDLDDRAADAWEPLFAIADLAGPEWAHRARSAARRLSGGRDEDEATNGAKLLAAIKTTLNGSDRMASADLLEAINADDDLPFGAWRDGKGLDNRTLARLLRPYGIKPSSVRMDDGSTPRGYLKAWFAEAWERYLPSDDTEACCGVADVADDSGEGVDPDAEADAAIQARLELEADAYVADALPAKSCSCGSAADVYADEDGDLRCRKCGRAPAAIVIDGTSSARGIS